MSAYVEEKEHIDLLVWAAGHLLPYYDAPEMTLEGGVKANPAIDRGRNQIGQVLWDTNRESVAYRYNETPDMVMYSYTPPRAGFSIGEVIKAIRGYKYQSCEHPEWKESIAAKWCDDLFHALVSEMPEVEGANTWSVTADTVPASANAVPASAK